MKYESFDTERLEVLKLLRRNQNKLPCIPSQTSVSPRSEEQIESEATARQQQETADLEEDEEEIALQKKKNVEVVSNALVTQDFLLDQDKTVGEVMIENGIEVRDFVRFEIGKGIDMDE